MHQVDTQNSPDKLGIGVTQKNMYNGFSNFLSPRDVHQIVDRSSEQIVSGKLSTTLANQQRRQERQQDHYSTAVIENESRENKIDSKFNARLRKDILKSTGQSIDKSQTNINIQKQIIKLLETVENSRKKCQNMMMQNEYESPKRSENKQFFDYRTTRSQVSLSPGHSNVFQKRNNLSHLNTSRCTEPNLLHSHTLIKHEGDQNNSKESHTSRKLRANHPPSKKENNLSSLPKGMFETLQSNTSFEIPSINEFKLSQQEPEQELSQKDSLRSRFISQSQREIALSFNNIGHDKTHIVHKSYFHETPSRSPQIISPNKQSQTILSSSPILPEDHVGDSKSRSFKPASLAYINQIKEIVGKAENVSNELLTDVITYSKALGLTSNLSQIQTKSDSSMQKWTSNPSFRTTKNRLKQEKKQEKKEESRTYHPYFEYLGYENSDEVPKNRSNQEILEQRYAYCMRQKEEEELKQSQTEKQSRKVNEIEKAQTILNKMNKFRKSDGQGEYSNSSLDSKESLDSIEELTEEKEHAFLLPREIVSARSIRCVNNVPFRTTSSERSINIPSLTQTHCKQQPQQQKQQEEYQLQQSDVRQITNNLPDNQKIPIVKQVLTKFGRSRSKEGDEILRKFSEWHKEDENKSRDIDYFFNQVQKQANRISIKYESIERDKEQQKKFLTLEKLKKKFSSPETINIEKLYRSQKEWTNLVKDVENSQHKIEGLTSSAKSQVNALKQINTDDKPHMKYIYQKAAAITGITFKNQGGRRLRLYDK